MIYRTEHPNPQWERKKWRNLNGEWEFDFDFGKTAVEKELFKQGSLSKKINVPFCPESELSGICYKDFMTSVCYRKTIELSEEDMKGRVILHFGAIDFKSYIYVNQKLTKTHIGGYSSFEIDITKYIKSGINEIFVIVEDDVRSGEQPAGKQCKEFSSFGAYYTRTTGIWQTVWLEFTPKNYLKSARYYPDYENGTLLVTGKVQGSGIVNITAAYDERNVGHASARTNGDSFSILLKLDEIHLWELGHGRLYDLEFEFCEDTVKSYFGLRNVSLKDKWFMLNSKCVFQRLVLDQGFYPDGIYTAKTDDELKHDIKISMDAGFNGARLHQKVFEKRFLYHCDKAGYMVWGEHANWGMNYTDAISGQNFICEWMEIIDRDFNHPSIIGWCPFNETGEYYEFRTNHRLIESVYNITKEMDETRPCIAVSGHYHIDEMEIYDVHDYCEDVETFKEGYAHIKEGRVTDQIARLEGGIQKYDGQPVFVSEYGGFLWSETEEKDDWGYGEAPKTIEELIKRYSTYTSYLINNPDIMGFCYTQLYDIEQEKNGLYTYNRKPKLDIAKIKEINEQTAEIEKNIPNK